MGRGEDEQLAERLVKVPQISHPIFLVADRQIATRVNLLSSSFLDTILMACRGRTSPLSSPPLCIVFSPLSSRSQLMLLGLSRSHAATEYSLSFPSILISLGRTHMCSLSPSTSSSLPFLSHLALTPKQDARMSCVRPTLQLIVGS